MDPWGYWRDQQIYLLHQHKRRQEILSESYGLLLPQPLEGNTVAGAEDSEDRTVVEVDSIDQQEEDDTTWGSIAGILPSLHRGQVYSFYVHI